MKVLNEWVENVFLYPPAELFAGKYGKDAKAEPRIVQAVESFYRLTVPEGERNLLIDLRAAHRDLEVLYNLGLKGIKPEAIKESTDKFLSVSKEVIAVLDVMFKKDQILQEYYSKFAIKHNVLKSAIYDLTKDL